MNGIVNIYKEAGFTSFDVVAKMRGILKIKKIGHTGTLDPDAVGVLPVCVGNATKLVEILSEHEKEYIATMRLGVETDTQDMSGQVLNTAKVLVTEGEVRSVVSSFVGEYDQIPPMYSALKVNGKKLYELAREGKSIERKARKVEFKEIEIISMELPIVKLRVTCSKGTYIRTLCHDIGMKLGCFGAMEHLIRTRVDEFTLDNAITLTELERLRNEEQLDKIFAKVDSFFMDLKGIILSDRYIKALENGNTIPLKFIIEEIDKTVENNTIEEIDKTVEIGKLKNGEQIRVYGENGKFYGVYEFYKGEEIFKPYKLFLH